MQAFGALAPVFPVNQVVPVRNEVAEGTTVVAERDPTVHATAGLLPELLGREGFVDLFPVTESNRDRPTLRQEAVVLEEAAWITHGRLLRPSWRP
jgi:hypothetical protein